MANGRKLDPSWKDERGGHFRLYWEVLDSNAWRCLSATDQRAYIALSRQLRSTNNGDLSLALADAKPIGITSKTTLAKSLRALVAVGLVDVTRKGGCTKGGQRLPTLYRFTDRQAYENPSKGIEASKATNEWKNIRTLGQGREAIRQAEDAAKTLAEKLKTQVQILTHTGPDIDPVGHLTGPNNGPWPPSPGSINGHGKKAEKRLQANKHAGLKKRSAVCLSENHGPQTGLLSTVAIHTGNLSATDDLGTYRRLTANPARLFTSLIH